MTHLMPVAGMPTPLSDHFRFFNVIPKPCPPRKSVSVLSGGCCYLRPSFLDVTKSSGACTGRGGQGMVTCCPAAGGREEGLQPKPIQGFLQIDLPKDCKLDKCRESKRRGFHCDVKCQPADQPHHRTSSSAPKRHPRRSLGAEAKDKTFTKCLLKMCQDSPYNRDKLAVEREDRAWASGLRQELKELDETFKSIDLQDLDVDMSKVVDPSEPRTRCQYVVNSPTGRTCMVCLPRPPKMETVPDYRRKRGITYGQPCH